MTVQAHQRARVVMWAAIALSVALAVALRARGWDERAWQVAAGVLLLSCIAVCIWSAGVANRCDRDVRAAVERLAEERRKAVGSDPALHRWAGDDDARP